MERRILRYTIEVDPRIIGDCKIPIGNLGGLSGYINAILRRESGRGYKGPYKIGESLVKVKATPKSLFLSLLFRNPSIELEVLGESEEDTRKILEKIHDSLEKDKIEVINDYWMRLEDQGEEIDYEKDDLKGLEFTIKKKEGILTEFKSKIKKTPFLTYQEEKCPQRNNYKFN